VTTLAVLVQERLASWFSLFPLVDEPTALKCAIEATKWYHGWHILTDAAGAPLVAPVIDGTLNIVDDEWSLIAPLATLFIEKTGSLMVEAARVAGVEMAGRDVATVEGDIRQYEIELQQTGFAELPVIAGLPTGY
jgi:hypothetical protein